MEREPIDWKPRASRRPVSHVATVKTPSGAEVRALIRNLSFEGCELITEQALSVGSTIRLDVPGRGAIDGQVRWVKGEHSGIRFLLGLSQLEQRRVRLGV